MILMGFISGVPYALTSSTLQAWMADEKVNLGVIGIFSLVSLPYALKFLWSPFMDRYVPPFLGRRRGWMVVAQVLLVASLVAMSFTKPSISPWPVALIAVLVTFFAASQDIVIDAYRTEFLKPVEYGAGSAVYTMGYRLAMLFSGAFALVLADHMPWHMVYLLMAAVMGLGIVITVFAPEPKTASLAPKTLRDAVVLPFGEFMKRRGSIEVIAFMILYKLDIWMVLALMTPFLLQLGFTKTEVGGALKTFGMIATIAGSFVGGGFMIKIGMKRALWFFGIFQAVSGAAFMTLASVGKSYSLLFAAVSIENFCSGMGIAAYSAFMMRLCDKRFTATQYALLTSLMAVTRAIAGAPSGFLVEWLGWQHYFLLSIFGGVPGLILLLRYDRWKLPEN